MQLKTFDDLEFKDHPCLGDDEETKQKVIAISPMFEGSLQAKITFDNGKKLSVIFGKMFYSNGIDTYEAMEIGTSEPRGYLTKEEVTKYMKEIQES